MEGTNDQQKEGLGIMTPDYYYYLNQSGTYKVDGTDDRKEYQETMVQETDSYYTSAFIEFINKNLMVQVN